MTSAGGGGGESPKNRRKKQNQLICDSDKRGGGQKIQKSCGCHIWKPPYNKQHSVSSSDTKAILHAPTELGEQVPIDESDPDGESDDDHRKDGREHVEEGGFL